MNKARSAVSQRNAIWRQRAFENYLGPEANLEDVEKGFEDFEHRLNDEERSELAKTQPLWKLPRNEIVALASQLEEYNAQYPIRRVPDDDKDEIVHLICDKPADGLRGCRITAPITGGQKSGTKFYLLDLVYAAFKGERPLAEAWKNRTGEVYQLCFRKDCFNPHHLEIGDGIKRKERIDCYNEDDNECTHEPKCIAAPAVEMPKEKKLAANKGAKKKANKTSEAEDEARKRMEDLKKREEKLDQEREELRREQAKFNELKSSGGKSSGEASTSNASKRPRDENSGGPSKIATPSRKSGRLQKQKQSEEEMDTENIDLPETP